MADEKKPLESGAFDDGEDTAVNLPAVGDGTSPGLDAEQFPDEAGFDDLDDTAVGIPALVIEAEEAGEAGDTGEVEALDDADLEELDEDEDGDTIV